MWELPTGAFLGTIIGASLRWVDKWFSAHTTERSKIYSEKFEVYKALNALAVDTLLTVLASEDENLMVDQYGKARSECFDYFQKNLFFISSDTINSIYELLDISIEDAFADKEKYQFKFFDMIKSFREDLAVSELHDTSKLIAKTPYLLKKSI
ncbi:hypothetical protein A7E75_04445 [Syntrophotalea acetylenica]|uniref:Uncharacterized protein n=2 Tax=Syntrophotalea acetylenica TaxID=29542 RepID=A0A1L3GF97_SYNAC|nr:hypothetical protein A7E75_04445 [Syntrophotalea acetylenica]APG44949.1 hypothetical protein A6070_13080 [Syntrophotalea acetylenica]